MKPKIYFVIAIELLVFDHLSVPRSRYPNHLRYSLPAWQVLKENREIVKRRRKVLK